MELEILYRGQVNVRQIWVPQMEEFRKEPVVWKISEETYSSDLN